MNLVIEGKWFLTTNLAFCHSLSLLRRWDLVLQTASKSVAIVISYLVWDIDFFARRLVHWRSLGCVVQTARGLLTNRHHHVVNNLLSLMLVWNLRSSHIACIIRQRLLLLGSEQVEWFMVLLSKGFVVAHWGEHTLGTGRARVRMTFDGWWQFWSLLFPQALICLALFCLLVVVWLCRDLRALLFSLLDILVQRNCAWSRFKPEVSLLYRDAFVEVSVRILINERAGLIVDCGRALNLRIAVIQSVSFPDRMNLSHDLRIISLLVRVAVIGVEKHSG